MLTASQRFSLGTTSLMLGLLFGVGCGGSGSSTSGGGSTFKVLTVSVPNNGTWQINRPIEFEFNQDVDFSSVNLNTINITQPNGAPAAGEFSLKNAHTVVFQPACPKLANYSDAGLLPNGVTYIVNVLGSAQGGPTVRSEGGRPLTSSQTVQFTTPISQILDPTILFLDPQLGAPAAVVRLDGSSLAASYVELGRDTSVAGRRYFEPRAIPDPALGADVPAGFKAPLNLYSDVNSAVSVIVALNQPVDPSAANITAANVDLQFLESGTTWTSIPHNVTLETNCSGTGSQLRLTPTGILPQGRTVRVVLSSDFKDLIGQTNIVPTVIGAFDVDFAKNPGTAVAGDGADAIKESFDVGGTATNSNEDTLSALPAPRAIWSSGKLDAAFAFDGTGGVGGNFDWVIGNASGLPETVILDTSFSVITNATSSASQSVVGGRVDIRSLWVRVGGTLVIQGPNPCRILCSGNIDPALAPPFPASVIVQGTIKCSGANSRGVVSFSTANIPEQGASGQGGGGDGGTGSYLTTQSTPSGGDGQGAFGVLGLGGKGGETGFRATSDVNQRRGAGGGGGVFGHDQMERARPACPDQRLNGLDAETGFNGGPNAQGALHGIGFVPPLGGGKGTSPFIDPNQNNDFWGTMVTSTGQIIVGELIKPHAGAGGGAGGDACSTATFPTTPFTAAGDEKGAGAGGGGGSLTILALGDIIVGTTGAGSRARIEVNGGYGGGGENTSGNDRVGGGSGGGSGGHLVLQSASQIDCTRLTSSSTAGPQGGIFARGGQGGAGALEAGGARATVGGANGETPAALDALPPALAYGTNPPCAVSPAQPTAATSDYTTSGGNPAQFQITNAVGAIAGCGGDGGPGIVQFHTPTLVDIKIPTGTVNFRDVCFPLPIGALPTNAATPAQWNQMLPIFGRRSFARSKWIPLGSASIAPASQVPDQIRFLFGGTDTTTGLVNRTGSGSTAKVLELPPILSANVVSEPAEPFITADKRTVAFDASALADDIYKRNPQIMVGFALKMTSSTSLVSTNFDIAAATYDPTLDQLRVTIATSGAPLALYVNGDTAAIIPRFFRVSTEGVLDSYPASAEIKIRFEAAPANALGQPNEAASTGFTNNIASLNSTAFKFIRFQVEFDIQADGGSLSPATPLPAIEFLNIPFRF